MRYVDLAVNPHVKDIFIKRTKLFNAMRGFFNDKGYFEVETPVLQSIPGGAAARIHYYASQCIGYSFIPSYCKRIIPKETNRWRF